MSPIQIESTFTKLLWFHYLFRDLILKSLSFSRKKPSIHYLFREINMNSLSSSRFHNECIVCFENSHWINLFRQITMNSLSATRYHYEYTIYFMISLWIHYLPRELTMTFCDANLRKIHYEYTMNTRKIHYEYTIDFANSF